MINTNLSPWPSFSEEEADAVREVLLSNKVNYWTGEQGKAFEREFADFVGSSYAIALANGTVALDLALIGLGIGPGDEVIVTPRTFLASVSSVVNVGATPVFADVNRDSQNIEAENIEKVLTPRTKAVIVVHLAGRPADMDPLMRLADKHDFKVIEDCAQAHGASYRGKQVGSIGHVGCWSFCQDKIITTGGEGGMVATNDEAVWRKMWAFKDHGKSYEAVYEKQHPPGFRWLHESFGTNWRMTEMQATLGRIQLARLPEWRAARKANTEQIIAACEGFNVVRTPIAPDYMENAYYKHYCFVEAEHMTEGWNRDRIVREVRALGVPCMQGSCSEVYLEEAFEGTTYRPSSSLPVAKELGETSLMFLVHPTLTEADMELTCNAIYKVLDLAQK